MLLFVPPFVLEAVTAEEWEIGVLRFVGLATVSLALMWDRAKNQSGTTLRPARRRAVTAWILLAAYLVSTTGLLLILGFSLLMASALEIALERAVAYSDALRRQIDPPNRPPTSTI